MSFEGSGDGILVKDEPETGDGEEGVAVGHHVDGVVDEEARKNLREQLKRTLTRRRESSIDTVVPARPSEEPRQYFVLTDAGKPVFASSTLADDYDNLASTAGLMQALLSVFIDDGDKLRFINAGKTRISFLLRTPLYYCCVSKWGEPESVTRSHLEYLHMQILSIVTASQLKRVFERRANFDLRRLLGGAETFLHLMLTRLQTDLAISTSSLHCLPLDATLRRKAGEILVPNSKMKEVLYVMLISRGRVLTIVRPRKRSVHPADLHILLNTIHAPAIFEAATTTPVSWLPICLPKFNADGFLHAYVQFLRPGDTVIEDTQSEAQTTSSDAVGSGDAVQTDPPTSKPTERHADVPDASVPYTSSSTASSSETSIILSPPPTATFDTSHLRGRIGTALVCISGGGGGEFENIRTWCEGVVQNLEESGTLPAIHTSIRRRPRNPVKAMKYGFGGDYSVSSLGISGLRHFIYKNRSLVQVTCPVWGDDYVGLAARRRVITLYQTIHDAIHAKSGQGAKEALKLQYIKTDKDCVMGWITQPFELYISVSPDLPKSSIVDIANTVARWVKREEGRLFLRDAPVF
ncbi:DUF254-domain-containing protein [Schizopora paradoxa]|uniref:Vacuolar fusion protein MON1 n=1 Tax=Schizopora paradoxa TaxID=27342 RepID=A0A0H2RYQ2_9AGAM|nr:DUF254-domain-containing protein [Schizopora paradoxa]